MQWTESFLGRTPNAAESGPAPQIPLFIARDPNRVYGSAMVLTRVLVPRDSQMISRVLTRLGRHRRTKTVWLLVLGVREQRRQRVRGRQRLQRARWSDRVMRAGHFGR